MKKKPNANEITVSVKQYADGTFQYNLWLRDAESNYTFIGSNEFRYKTPEEALKAGLEHREEWCKPEKND